MTNEELAQQAVEIVSRQRKTVTDKVSALFAAMRATEQLQLLAISFMKDNGHDCSDCDEFPCDALVSLVGCLALATIEPQRIRDDLAARIN